MILIEACIDSVADAVAAERAGAGCVELCANLLEGGTTPSAGMVRTTVAKLSIPVGAIIRARGGDFLYSSDEIEVMLRDIEAVKAAGAHGIVGGALHANGAIDEDGTEAMLEAAAPLPFTFHRAFDLTRNLNESLDTCLALGVTRVLTSGGCATAFEGADALHRLHLRAKERLVVMAGGGVRADHARQLVSRTGVRAIHLGPRRAAHSGMHLPPGPTRVNKTPGDGSSWMELDSAEVARVVQTLVNDA